MFCVDYFIFMVLSYCYFGRETEKDGRRHLAWVPFWILHLKCNLNKVCEVPVNLKKKSTTKDVENFPRFINKYCNDLVLRQQNFFHLKVIKFVI